MSYLLLSSFLLAEEEAVAEAPAAAPAVYVPAFRSPLLEPTSFMWVSRGRFALTGTTRVKVHRRHASVGTLGVSGTTTVRRFAHEADDEEILLLLL